MTDEAIRLFTALHRLGRQMHRFAHVLEQDCLRYYREQSRLLDLIGGHRGIIQKDLAEAMDMRPPSMAQMLHKMATCGLIFRKQDEKDQRIQHVFLTEKGKQVAAESQKTTEWLAGALFAHFSDKEIRQTLSFTLKLCDNLDQIVSREGPTSFHQKFTEQFKAHLCSDPQESPSRKVGK